MPPLLALTVAVYARERQAPIVRTTGLSGRKMERGDQ
jgi:hypothetical protein